MGYWSSFICFRGDEIEEILGTALAKIRIFVNIYSYTGGAHKSIKGYHSFFVNNPEHVRATFNCMLSTGMPNDLYVMICEG